MPVIQQDTEVAQIGNGVAVAFTFACEVTKAADIEVSIDGLVTSAYVLTGLGVDGGCTVTFTTAPANLARIVFRRIVPYSRTDFDYQTLGVFEANTVDDDIERVIMQVQQLRTMLKRAPLAPVATLGLNLSLVPEASKLWAWSADALSMVNVSAATITPSSVIFSTLGQQLAVAATKEAAQDIIGLTGGPRSVVGGRLALENNIPFRGLQVQNNVVYYVPFTGTTIGLNNGGTWFLYDFLFGGTPSLSIAALTDNRLFDVFVSPTGAPGSSPVSLSGVSWTNETTPAVSRTLIDGILTKTGDNTARYLGTARKRAGLVRETTTELELWNMYNQIPRYSSVVEATASWAIAASATWRQANAAAANQINFCVGYGFGNVAAVSYARAINSTATARLLAAGLGYDSITINSAPITVPASCTSTQSGQAMAINPGRNAGIFDIGQHYVAWLERGDGVETQTFQGTGGLPTNSQGLGMSLMLMA